MNGVVPIPNVNQASVICLDVGLAPTIPTAKHNMIMHVTMTDATKNLEISFAVDGSAKEKYYKISEQRMIHVHGMVLVVISMENVHAT
jgi:hypothetical protein